MFRVKQNKFVMRFSHHAHHQRYDGRNNFAAIDNDDSLKEIVLENIMGGIKPS